MIELYEHNQKAYENVCKIWETENKTAIIHATGTGKSYVILRCIEDFKGKNVIILAPSKYILDQIKEHGSESISSNIITMTYSKLSMMSLKDIQKLSPSLIILDEFHRCGAKKWNKGVIQLLDAFSNSKVLGTTATPIRYLDNERNMCDELFNEHTASDISLSDAIIRGILPMPKYIAALYTFHEELSILEDKIQKSILTDDEKEKLIKETQKLKDFLYKSKGISEILSKHMNKKDNKFIVFCKNKKHLDIMKPIVIQWFKDLNLFNNIDTYSVYTKYSDNRKQIKLFSENKCQDTIKLLFSIDMLNEGIHVEDISGVILLRPTISKIIYYQQIGRSIQTSNISHPLIFDFVNNFKSINGQTFFNDLQESFKRNKNNITTEIDIKDFILIDEILESISLFKNIEDQIPTAYKPWELMYNKLKTHWINTGNSNYISKEDNTALRYWVINQRKKYKDGLLTEDKIKKLENIEFIWDCVDHYWKYRISLFKNFHKKNGHLNITSSNKELFASVASIRVAYARNELSGDKIKELEEIGFIFNKLDYAWQLAFDEYKEVIERDGKLKIGYVSKEGKRLDYWVADQRERYKKNKLQQERINKLNSIGFIWDVAPIEDPSLSKYHIKNILIQNNMSHKELADLLNISRATIDNLSASQDKMSRNIANKLGNLFNIDPDLIEPQYIPKKIDNLGDYHIRNLLIKHNLTYANVADLIGISANTLKSWSNNKQNKFIPKKRAELLGLLFDVDPNLIEPQKRDKAI